MAARKKISVKKGKKRIKRANIIEFYIKKSQGSNEGMKTAFFFKKQKYQY
jgi:hypothetical protein